MSTQEDLAKQAAPGAVHQNIEAIMALQNSENESMSRHQRAVERMVIALTYPAFLFGVVTAIGFWIGLNIAIKMFGSEPFDPPPFAGLQTSVSVLALVMTSLIIITQSRQGRTAERNSHLDLQVNLLVDQKAAKIIQLLEEMRFDSPYLRNRKDEEAEELQVAVDPSHVASVIAEKMAVSNAFLEEQQADAEAE